VHAGESDILTRRIGAGADSVLRPSGLEDVFLHLTGRDLSGEA
jgi:hypothetical protein